MQTLDDVKNKIDLQRLAVLKAFKDGGAPIESEDAARIVYWLDQAGFEITKKTES